MSDADGRNEQAWQAGEDERVSILGVAKQRLPGYLAAFTVTVVCVLVVAIVSSWDSIGEIVRYYSHLLSTYVPAVVTTMIAVEGGIMGATALLLKLNREKAAEEGRKEGIREGIREGIQKGRQEGRQEGIQEGRQEGIREGIRETIQFLEQSGKDDVAQFLRREQSNGWGGGQG